MWRLRVMSSCGDGSDFTRATFGGQLPHAFHPTTGPATGLAGTLTSMYWTTAPSSAVSTAIAARTLVITWVGSPRRISGPFTNPSATPPGVSVIDRVPDR